MQRIGKMIKPDNVFKNIGDKRVEFNGWSIKMGSLRYKVFSNSPVCAACGIVGTRFYVEKHPEQQTAHLNFYAVKDGREILMTKDHIIPRSKGGTDDLDNLQTMCRICNERKADK